MFGHLHLANRWRHVHSGQLRGCYEPVSKAVESRWNVGERVNEIKIPLFSLTSRR